MTDKQSLMEKPKNERKKVVEDSRGNGEQGDSSSHEVKPLYERIDPVLAWLIVAAAFLGGGLFAIANVSAGHGLWFLIVGSITALPFWALLTESGLNWLNNLDSIQKENNSTQSVNVGNSSEREVICPTCGWKNPQENNYCHDCGSEISSQQ